MPALWRYALFLIKFGYGLAEEDMQSWAAPGESDRDALEWANGLPDGPERDAFLAGLCTTSNMADPEDAMQKALLMSPGKAQTEIFQETAFRWVCELLAK